MLAQANTSGGSKKSGLLMHRKLKSPATLKEYSTFFSQYTNTKNHSMKQLLPKVTTPTQRSEAKSRLKLAKSPNFTENQLQSMMKLSHTLTLTNLGNTRELSRNSRYQRNFITERKSIGLISKTMDETSTREKATPLRCIFQNQQKPEVSAEQMTIYTQNKTSPIKKTRRQIRKKEN